MATRTPFLDVEEAGKYLKVKKSTIYAWIQRKKRLNFPVRYHGRKPVFHEEDLVQWSNDRNKLSLSA